ncbi:polyphosphate kinase 2 family protein [Desertibaculum subflavum]|uniref:polyphosphate kinase 2 family protein n=1 Tax=Desertibaculum subflavum TaxID=2268458 RepID=UPI000E66CEA4
MNMKNLLKRYRIDDGRKFRLKDIVPNDTAGLDIEKDAAKALLKGGVERMAGLQERLYARDRWSVLLIFQAMDAAGKDSTIKHVMSGINPQGCEVHSFKAPSGEELDHDFLWRTTRRLPERGRIGIFNRSYYEEVLVVRVHREILAAQKLAPELVTRNIWLQRFQDIRAFEAYLGRNGTVVRKFFLHVSKEEQRRRFLERIETPEKNWKFSMADVAERAHWKEYMAAYEEMIAATSTREAPWYVVPADNKWFTRLVVAAAVDDALDDLDLKLPPVSPRQKRELARARKALLAEKPPRR